MKSIIPLILFLVVIFAFGCSDDSSTEPKPNDPDLDFVGTWEGNAIGGSINFSITFVVSNVNNKAKITSYKSVSTNFQGLDPYEDDNTDGLCGVDDKKFSVKVAIQTLSGEFDGSFCSCTFVHGAADPTNFTARKKE